MTKLHSLIQELEKYCKEPHGCNAMAHEQIIVRDIPKLLECLKVLSEACEFYSVNHGFKSDGKHWELVDKAKIARQALEKCEEILK